jgi:hypothetical protein
MSKTTVPDVAELLKEAQSLLDAKCKRQKFRLKIPADGYRVDDDWITIVVSPTGTGLRAYDYVEILSAVEKELRARGHEHVLLVPALAD